MSSLISVGVKSGFQIIRYYFCKSLERGDYTNEQILNVFESKIATISKDLEDLKLQKLRSAAFLLRSGVQMYHANDHEEARRNFDKAEMDAVEAFSTAPSIDWKVIAVKIAICSHIWRKAVLLQGSVTLNFESVLKQVLLHIHRLLDDDGIRSNIKTHVGGSFLSNINKSKRVELINTVLEIEENSRKVLFDNFLEILPSSYVKYDGTSSVSLLSLTSNRHDLVPFSPRQCSVIEPIPAIKSWRNVSCAISLERNAIQEMVSCGTDHNENDVYVAERKWIDLYSTVKNLMGSIQNFEISQDKTLQLILDADDDGSLRNFCRDSFEIVYLCIKVSYKCTPENPPRVYIYLDNNQLPGSTFHMAVKSRGGSDQIYSGSFYRGNDLIKMLNQNRNSSSVLNVNLFAANGDIEARNFEVMVHYKSRDMRAFQNDVANTNTLHFDAAKCK